MSKKPDVNGRQVLLCVATRAMKLLSSSDHLHAAAVRQELRQDGVQPWASKLRPGRAGLFITSVFYLCPVMFISRVHPLFLEGQIHTSSQI